MSEAKTKGNFSFPVLLIILNFLNAFRWLESLMNKGFHLLYVHVYLAICPRLPCNMSTFTLQYVHVYLALVHK
ncbi:hypothetical protein EA736_15760 [Acinetobacter baumannii]|nr:hypothetical protein SF14_0205520 [Acinetobacter baumannii]OTM69936.1 hypothetical protein B9X99_08080 [Acinetobacter pittii]OLU57452.1 hypothetical protein SG94_0205435 [Acinetobacter baumannii]OLU58087.1 hypothetical protein SG92_0200175 [Acinetobacter baumannii]OLU65949.1 hypothetical protein SG95_0207595 [Acinetobacter baumannii]